MLKINFKNNKPLTILCLGAHCDDIEIGAGGTVLRMLTEYDIYSVHWVVLASNEIRKKEAEQSSELFLDKIENTNVAINSWRDGFLPYIGSEIKDYFESLKNQISPDLIFTHYRNDRHQDHRYISDLTWNTWRNHLILEYEIPKYDGDLGVPNFFVTLNEEIIAKKNKIIIDKYKSQTEKHWFDDENFRSLARLRGMESAVMYAEAFFARKISL